jgi:pimeloyl-ACP methyl ester carboxylesterase
MRRKTWGTAGAIVLCLVLVGVVAVGCILPLRRGYTPPYHSARSIASLERINLGGLPQCTLIRGVDSKNPLLLFLHGGPGMPTMYLAHDFQRELENNFTVVEWDRRGAGKSFVPGISREDMTVSHEISDTIKLIDQLRARFHQPKVYLVGFSYGTYLGILVAQAAPERLYAYVGIGQLACSEEENRSIQDKWIRNQATRAHDNEAIEELDGKKPLDREKWLFKYGGEIHSAKSWWPLLWSGLRSPEYTFGDIANIKRGVDFTSRSLQYDVIHGSILKNVSALQVPVYFFAGCFDYTDPTICTLRLFEKISAPSKKLVWFDHSAHFIFVEEPSRFAAEMRLVEQETADGSVPSALVHEKPNWALEPLPWPSCREQARCKWSARPNLTRPAAILSRP